MINFYTPVYSNEQHQQILNALLSSSPAIIGVKDLRGRYIVVNEQYKRLFNRELNDFIGKTLDEALADCNLQHETNDNWINLLKGEPSTIEETVLIDGIKNVFLTVKFPILDDDDQISALGIIATDITERKIIEKQLAVANFEREQKIHEVNALKEKLYQQSIRDPLTNLFNRRYLDGALQRELKIAKESDLPFSIVMIDLDNFKSVNDNYGHLFGDQVLQNFSELMLSQLTTRQLIARTGGEEFMLVLPKTNAQKALEVAEQLRNLYANLANKLEEQSIYNTFSAGIAEYPNNGVKLEELLKASDEALYLAKTEGRNQSKIHKAA